MNMNNKLNSGIKIVKIRMNWHPFSLIDFATPLLNSRNLVLKREDSSEQIHIFDCLFFKQVSNFYNSFNLIYWLIHIEISIKNVFIFME